jgi:hypothetical protein
MLVDAYRVFNTALSPQKEDINGFFSTLDVDRDNQVRLHDLENLCVRYLTGSVMDREFKFHSTMASHQLQPPRQQGQTFSSVQGKFYGWICMESEIWTLINQQWIQLIGSVTMGLKLENILFE